MARNIGLLGFGYALPDHVRSNSDPIFSQIRTKANSRGLSEHSLFTGMKERRVLQPGESLAELMTKAARQAVDEAGLEMGQIDRLYGYGSVAEYVTPNVLYKVHHDTGLPASTFVVPIHSDFSNYTVSLIQAWEAIEAGHCRYALVVSGGHFTRHGDYTAGHSLSLGDGAGAVVIGRGTRFRFIDYISETISAEYGYMTVQHREQIQDGIRSWPVDEYNRAIPTFGIEQEEGLYSFLSTGMDAPPRMINQLLKRHGLTGEQVTLIGHQASRKLMDHWASLIQPKAYLDTFEEYGNMALASVAVTLARFHKQIHTEYLLLHSLGLGFHHTALLIHCNHRRD
ncbi:3-oxoacyl-ACP synthase III family protein [Brevibacillus migulae]|uniref:3-oxoacyl-ACP synthase III family protein n=1 Tax=Brevibacillus migulae TaxID=1644114 RepID=UPI00106E43AF|nr:3-oxoacyl-[acyl-carrier-protein] synthase III C-terminal domain-containing protein [Brevibacillus migulae]